MVDRAGRVAVHTGRGCIAARRPRGGQPGERPGEHHGPRHRAGGDGRGLRPRPARARGAAARRPRCGRGRGRRPARPPVGRAVVVAAARTGRPGEDTPGPARGRPPRAAGRAAPPGRLQRAYARVDAGDQLAAAGDAAGALREYAAAHRASPTTPSSPSGTARRWPRAGASRRRRRSCASVFEARPGWAELLERLPAAGLFPDDGELIARLIGTRAESARVAPPRPRNEPCSTTGRGSTCKAETAATAWSRSGARRTCPRAVPTAATAGAGATS